MIGCCLNIYILININQLIIKFRKGVSILDMEANLSANACKEEREEDKEGSLLAETVEFDREVREGTVR